MLGEEGKFTTTSHGHRKFARFRQRRGHKIEKENDTEMVLRSGHAAK